MGRTARLLNLYPGFNLDDETWWTTGYDITMPDPVSNELTFGMQAYKYGPDSDDECQDLELDEDIEGYSCKSYQHYCTLSPDGKTGGKHIGQYDAESNLEHLKLIPGSETEGPWSGFGAFRGYYNGILKNSPTSKADASHVCCACGGGKNRRTKELRNTKLSRWCAEITENDLTYLPKGALQPILDHFNLADGKALEDACKTSGKIPHDP